MRKHRQPAALAFLRVAGTSPDTDMNPDPFSLVAQLERLTGQDQPARKERKRDRVLALLQRKRVVTVVDVMRELGMPDKTARRILDELTPIDARALPGRPARWRVV